MPKLFGSARSKFRSWRKNLDAGKLKGMADERPDSQESIAWRLKCLRWAIARDNQTRFAAHLNIDAKRWNNFERGSPLSKDVALKIVQAWPDISLDWLFRGLDDHLTVKRQRELVEAAKALTSAVRSETRVG